jgi:predicted nucleic acid-binding protein
MAKSTVVMSFMSVNVFIDTNILVYAHDILHGHKHDISRKILADAWEGRISAGISIQVLQEFYTTMLRKGGEARPYREAVNDYLHWPVVENTKELLRRAMDVHHRYGTSFYDANIIAAAQMSGAKELWTEDLNTGQDYGGVVAVNPLI